MLKIDLFGAGSAELEDRALVGFPSQQAGLLFCYLLLNRKRPVLREKLAAVFWEDLPALTARKYLRNALWRLKQMLEAAGYDADRILSITDEHVRILCSEEVRIDLDVFEAAYAGASRFQPEALSSVQVEALETAADSYTGDLLQGIYEDWTLYDRERFRLMYLGICQKLMLHHGAYRRFDQALYHGERILAIDPAREKIHRHMMRLYAMTGDRNSALAQYKRCKQILKDELNLSPMKETRALYREIMENVFDRKNTPSQPQNDSVPNILERLHKLQRLSNRIHAELRTLEKLLNQNALDPD